MTELFRLFLSILQLIASPNTPTYFFQSTWRCSVCRRKIASRGQPIVTQESTDSLLEVPVLEALQRRHSDARLSCQAGGQTPGLSSGLAPPRSPELRRHSDVSPASLKELEKVTTLEYSFTPLPPTFNPLSPIPHLTHSSTVSCYSKCSFSHR